MTAQDRAETGPVTSDMHRSARVRVVRVEAKVVRTPIAVPVRTSFGMMRDRPALFLRVTDADGAAGFGEVWCNFPRWGPNIVRGWPMR